MEQAQAMEKILQVSIIKKTMELIVFTGMQIWSLAESSVVGPQYFLLMRIRLRFFMRIRNLIKVLRLCNNGLQTLQWPPRL
jgi:hypothetical protein